MADCPANCGALEAAPAQVRDRVRVLLPLPLPAALDYRGPDGEAPPEPGRFVRVTLGSRELIGVVWEGAGEDVPDARLKPIAELLSAPPLPPELRRFIERVAAYTLAPPGMVLSMAMRSEAALLPLTPRRVCAITEAGLAVLAESPPPKRLTPGRRRALEVLRDGPAATIAETAREAGVGAGVVRGVIAAGLAAEHLAAAVPPHIEQPDWRAPGLKLSTAQGNAAKKLVARVESGGFHVTVLDGVTGSGKTETYFAAIAAALARGTQVLVLLPEIALSAQWLERFRRRFGASPVEWHSDIGQSQRRDAWRAVAAGRARVVVGARSALFLPFPELGLVVVDEEHDLSYKQEDGVCYQARDMAVLRASLAQIPIVLVSATPSLETVINVSRGRYERVHLPERHGMASLPSIALIDMRKEKLTSGRFLSPPLVKALEETLAEGEQALLFLNRRGYAPLTLCRACGHRFQCPSCTAWLVEHRFTGRLQCHHCGYSVPVPPFCPECLAAGTLVPCGPGVERLSEEVAERFPTARTALMVSDALPGPRAA
ncbi:MAG TPA: primosomal protein N', partial [Stellaceae bacterium]|nr:primosomal protein N' [Stellaceae bacterium]